MRVEIAFESGLRGGSSNAMMCRWIVFPRQGCFCPALGIDRPMCASQVEVRPLGLGDDTVIEWTLVRGGC